MNKTAQSVWDNCLSFIKDNIQDQAYKTWFEPIKSVELTDNALYIQVPSKFFYEWLEEHYVKLLKVALTKELGKNAKLLYKIRMENTYGNKQPFTEQLPSANGEASGQSCLAGGTSNDVLLGGPASYTDTLSRAERRG